MAKYRDIPMVFNGALWARDVRYQVELLLEAGLTFEEVAVAELGVHQSTLRRYCDGDFQVKHPYPQMTNFVSVSNYFGLNLADYWQLAY